MFTAGTFDQYIKKIVDYIKKNPPVCNDEFKLYTKYLYGVILECSYDQYLKEDNAVGLYHVSGNVLEYSKGDLYRAWEKKFGSYDGLKVLLNNTFGRVCSGGVAAHHYGQVKISKDKYESLKDWNKPQDIVKLYIKEVELLQLIEKI
jgi:hypothetical protein